jgi:hypothetical protein
MVACAFTASAFQQDAFQTCTPVPSGGGVVVVGPSRRRPRFASPEMPWHFRPTFPHIEEEAEQSAVVPQAVYLRSELSATAAVASYTRSHVEDESWLLGLEDDSEEGWLLR